MKKCTGFAFALLVLGAFALTGCGSDEGVTGGEGIDAIIGGSDTGQLADSNTAEDVYLGWDGFTDSDWYTNVDGYVGYDGMTDSDFYVGYDTGPIGCTSDFNCPSTPCAKGVCDLAIQQCAFYKAPDGTLCGPPPTPVSCIGQGFCQNGQCTAAGTSCEDGDPCTNDYCDQTGNCMHIPSPGCGGCKGDFSCDDANPCTYDICNPETGTCMHSTIPNCGTAGCVSAFQCEDYNDCTVDNCVFAPNGVGLCAHSANLSYPGKCCDPTSSAIFCNDGNSCTSDYCSPNYQCIYQPIPNCGGVGCKSDAECNDNIKCSIDKCQQDATGAGKCTHYGDLSQKGFCCDPYMNMQTCFDGNDCTYDQCGMDYQCAYAPIPGCGTTGCKSNLECNDGNACTQDMCYGGQCSYGGVACASPDKCLAASCDPKTGQCVYTPIPGCGTTGCKSSIECNDGNACTQDQCSGGQCTYSSMTCLSADPCIAAACDPFSGQCIYSAIPGCVTSGCTSDFMCDDYNFCTVDVCSLSSSGQGTCYHKFDATQAPGYCCDPTSSSMPPCSDGDSCTQDMCGPEYQCQFLPIPGCVFKCKADTDCAGGDVCTIAKCDVASGVCLYGSIPNCCNPAWCDDGDPCTKDGCDASSGGCTSMPIPGCVKPCDPQMCNDYNPCTTDQCDKLGNCQNLPIPGCAVQFCKSDMECQDADPCTKDYCDYASYTCAHISPPGGCGVTFCKTNAECNDFNACTGDLCLNNQCAHKDVTCDDGNPCTADQCLAMTGGCSNAAIPGCIATPCKASAPCNDNNPCTTDSCVSGWCNFAQIPGCFGFP